jgi:hypothetical protein
MKRENIKNLRPKLSVLVAAFVLGSSAFGDDKSLQTTLTVDQAIAEGLSHSPQIQKSRAVVQEFRWKKLESIGQGFMPKISLSGTHYFANQYAVTQVNLGAGILAFPGFYSMVLPMYFRSREIALLSKPQKKNYHGRSFNFAKIFNWPSSKL